ncbi:glycosyltransferase family 2 protein [Neobacillus muris]|uniref:glycosyltransferase family 2 protein n=1 Tax=Neobacillus muris TaxID=2941334 RepID=UPI00204201BC|nr:glycosyltransferase [Neobacillus muris]
MNPVISIIVPVYNVEPYIKDCINSILTQDFINFELLLVNDGSTDKSGAICDEFAKRDTRVKVIHKHFEGVSSARNIGISLAQGDFIGFVDGDDHIDKNMYKELHRICIETNSDIAICKLAREVDGKIINVDTNIFMKEMNNIEAMKQLFIGKLYRFSLCNKLFRKHCFENVSFPEGRIHEDLSTAYKLFSNANKATYTNYSGYIYVKRQNSILTSAFNKRRMDAFIGWEEILPFMNKYYPEIYEEVVRCFVFWSIDNVFYILHQVNDSKDRNSYLRKIQENMRSHYRYILRINSIPLLYKYYMTMLMINFRLLIISKEIKTIFLKKK